MVSPRDAAKVQYISPRAEVDAGLWTLFAGASVFLGLRIWCKHTRRNGLWYDDYMLILSWAALMLTNTLITYEYATGYATGNWDDTMHILINISSCSNLVGQAFSKTAFGITLLRMSNRKQMAILSFCIITMNIYMILKSFFQWAKYCDNPSYQSWYRLQGPCINYDFEQNFKAGGNTYNIIMDFIFAVFPWWITWSLDMRKFEKIALCATMSLGMVIAIFSAIRTTWMLRPIMHVHDAYYIWRDGMSNIWYSAEVAGTIIVQCIPILRPLLRDMQTSMTSTTLRGTDDRQSVTWRSTLDGKRGLASMNSDDVGRVNTEAIALGVITEEPRLAGDGPFASSTPLETDHSTPTIPVGPLSSDSWLSSGSEHSDIHSPQSPQYCTWFEMEPHGLSPQPIRTTRT